MDQHLKTEARTPFVYEEQYECEICGTQIPETHKLVDKSDVNAAPLRVCVGCYLEEIAK